MTTHHSRRWFSLVLPAILLALWPALMQAQPGALDGDLIRASLKVGQRIVIIDMAGSEHAGRVTELTADGLRLGANASSLRYDEIVRIDRPADTLANGAWIGFAAGSALAVQAVLTYDDDACHTEYDWACTEPSGGGIVAGTLIAGALGAAIGVGIDALFHHDRAIYRRGALPRASLTPVALPGVRGAAVAFRW